MEREWPQYSDIFKELFSLEYSPVALACLDRPLSQEAQSRARICRAILDAGKGKIVQIGKNNNACFGAGWHLGFNKIRDEKITGMIKKFVVEGEKLFCSYEALDNLLSQLEPPPDNSSAYFTLAPLESAEFRPQLVIFICNAETACRLLTLVTFLDGKMPAIKIGGPTCRMGIIYPLQSREVNISFYDYTARKMCNVEKDKLLVSVPYEMIPKLAGSIDKCSGGKAKVEFLPEFREFLQKRLAPAKNG